MQSPSYFYAFDDQAAAIAAGAMIAEGEEVMLAASEALILRTTGIELTLPIIDPETDEITTPATMSKPLVILSPVMLPGCSTHLIDPPGHQGFA